MAQRFLYRPVDSGYENLADGIIGGIQQGVANFQQGRENTRLQKRQDAQDAEHDEDREMSLADRGWHSGTAPLRQRTVHLTPDALLTAMQEPDTTTATEPGGVGLHSHAQQGGGMGVHPFQMQRNAPSISSVQQNEPQYGTGWIKPDMALHAPHSFDVTEHDPNYMQVGGRYHMTPEAEQDRAFATADAREEDAYQKNYGRKRAEAVDTREITEQQRQVMEDNIASALADEHPQWTTQRVRSQAHIASMDDAILKELMGPDHAAETLAETKRHNGAMESIGRTREDRLTHDPNAGAKQADAARKDLLQRAQGYAATLIRRGTKPADVNANVLKYFGRGMRPGDVDMVVEQATKLKSNAAADDGDYGSDTTAPATTSAPARATPTAPRDSMAAKSASQKDWEAKRRQPAPPKAAAPAARALSDSDVAAARAALRGSPDPLGDLRAEGFSDAEIKVIIGH